MNTHIPKDYIDLDLMYPVSIHENIGISPLYQRAHWHEMLEINLIQQGKGYYIINGNRLDFEEGDILLINSEDLHRAYEISDNLRLLVISFHPAWFKSDATYDSQLMAPYKEMGKFYTNLIPHNHSESEELRQILLSILKEHTEKDFAYVSNIRAMLMFFLAKVGRNLRIKNETEVQDPISISKKQLEKIKEVILIMEKQYEQPWSLQKLSEQAYMSPSHFRTLFRKVTGRAPMEYLIQIRISNAVQMLEKSEGNVTEVALACGFKSISNFNRLFTKKTGEKPTDILFKR